MAASERRGKTLKGVQYFFIKAQATRVYKLEHHIITREHMTQNEKTPTYDVHLEHTSVYDQNLTPTLQAGVERGGGDPSQLP